MRTIRLIWVPTFALLWALCACSSTRVENGTDSTTHWLRRCDSAAECGGLSCLCGVCNTSCSSDQQCRGLDSTAVCTPTPDRCSESERSCAPGPDRSAGDVMEMGTKAMEATASSTADAAAGQDAGAPADPDASAPRTSADAALDSGVDSADGDVELQSPEPTGAPLLDRPSVGDYTCTVSRPVSTLPIDPKSASAAVAELGGVGHVFWIAGQMFGVDGPLRTAAVGIDGLLQTAHDVPAPDANVTSTSPNVRVVAAHDRLTLWWGYNTGGIDALGALVQLDAAGNALAPSRRFDGGPYPYDAIIAATATGFVAVWGELTTKGCDLTLLDLDASAQVAGTRKTLTSLVTQPPADGEYQTCAVTALTATPNGYALVYERSRAAGNILAYQAFDSEGAPLVPATRLTPPGSWRFGANLIAHGDDVLVAWSVMVGPT